MIISVDDIRKNLEENFDLGEAIRNDSVDLIFGNYDLLSENEKIDGKNKMQIMIRNQEEDNIPHNFTMKFTPKIGDRKDDKDFYHDGYYGLPISFERGSKKWHVDLGPGKKSEAKAVERKLKKIERKFISSVVDQIGDDILDYWEVKNIHTSEGKEELNSIVERIRVKYEK